MATKAQLKAQAKYDKENTQQVVLKLNIKHDADILAKLQNEANKQGYIKDLVRKDMRNLESVLSLDSIKYLLLRSSIAMTSNRSAFLAPTQEMKQSQAVTLIF